MDILVIVVRSLGIISYRHVGKPRAKASYHNYKITHSSVSNSTAMQSVLLPDFILTLLGFFSFFLIFTTFLVTGMRVPELTGSAGLTAGQVGVGVSWRGYTEIRNSLHMFLDF